MAPVLIVSAVPGTTPASPLATGNASQPVSTAQVWKGAANSARLGTVYDLSAQSSVYAQYTNATIPVGSLFLLSAKRLEKDWV